MVGQPRVHPDVVPDVEVRDVVGVHPLPAELAQVPLHGELRPPGAGEAGEEGEELLGEHDVIRGEGAEDVSSVLESITLEVLLLLALF